MMMRRINKIIVHCSDTPESMNIGFKEINSWHKQRGWSGCGYHYIIRRNGVIEIGRQESQIGAHCFGYNSKSIGVCLIGQGDYTETQMMSFDSLIKELKERHEESSVHGHNEFSNKKCPMFDIKKYMKDEH